MIIEQDKMFDMNYDTSTRVPNLTGENTTTPNLEDTNTLVPNLEDTWIPKLEDVNIHLVKALIQFLEREKGKKKGNSEFISKLNVAIFNLSAAFHLADHSESNQVKVNDNIEQIYYLAVRFDLLKAHVEGIAKINNQGVSNITEKASSGTQENGPKNGSNNEKSGSCDDTINHKNTAELQNTAKNTEVDKLERNSKDKNGGNIENDTQHELNSTDKGEEMQTDLFERIQVFFHCDLCKKTFQEEKELKEHKEFWRGSSWSCASGYRFPESKYCRACKGSYWPKDTLEHEKRCPGSKTNTCEESVRTLSQSNVLTAQSHKRANPDVEKGLQNGEIDLNNHRSKIRKKTNVEEKIITELKEEYNDINSVIDIKEETIEEEGIEDPLSSVDHSLIGCPEQEESHCNQMKAPVSENIQQYSEATLDMTKGLKRILHDNTEILAKVENTESSINFLKQQIDQILKLSIANNGKLKQLNQTLPSVTIKAGKKTWSNVMELEEQLKDDKNGNLADHLVQIFQEIVGRKVKSSKNDCKRIRLKTLLEFIFDWPDEASNYTSVRDVTGKKIFTICCKQLYQIIQGVMITSTDYDAITFKKDFCDYIQNAPRQRAENKASAKLLAQRRRREKNSKEAKEADIVTVVGQQPPQILPPSGQIQYY